MENKPKTEKFSPVNFNLKKIIFSFLKPSDQRKIYWLNKKLRQYLPENSIRINITCLKKQNSYKLGFFADNLLELSEGNFLCWEKKSIKLLKLDRNTYNFELIDRFEITKGELGLFMQSSFALTYAFKNARNIILELDMMLAVLDINCKVLDDELYIYQPCVTKISSSSFAAGKCDGVVKIFSRNESEFNYKVITEFTPNLKQNVLCLLYLLKHDLLLCGSEDGNIIVYKMSSFNKVLTLDDHQDELISLVSLNDDNFASSSLNGEIKFWCIKSESSIECINTVKPYLMDSYVQLCQLGKDLVMSWKSGIKKFKIWNGKSKQPIITFEEESAIEQLIITQKNYIITVTENPNYNLYDKGHVLNVWKIPQ